MSSTNLDVPPIIPCPGLRPDAHVLLCPRLPDVPAFWVECQRIKDIRFFQDLTNRIKRWSKPDIVVAVLNDIAMDVRYCDFLSLELTAPVSG